MAHHLPVSVTLTNLVGSVLDIQDDPATPDNLWLTALLTENTIADVSFETPERTLVGTQTVRVLCRKNATGGNDPNVTVQVLENGTVVSTLQNNIIVTDNQLVLTATFDASILTNLNTSPMIRVQGSRSGGPSSSRRTVEVGAIAFDSTMVEPVVEYTPHPSRPTGSLFRNATAEAKVVSWCFDSAHFDEALGHLVSTTHLLNEITVQPGATLVVDTTSPNAFFVRDAAINAGLEVVE